MALTHVRTYAAPAPVPPGNVHIAIILMPRDVPNEYLYLTILLFYYLSICLSVYLQLVLQQRHRITIIEHHEAS